MTRLPETQLPETLWGLVDHGASTWPGATMLRSRQGDEATFAEYRERAERMAAGLSDMGIGAGDVVSWILPTWVDTVVLAGALARLGAVQNPIIAIYRDREVGFCCRQSGARLLITPGEFGGYDFAAMGARVAADVDGTPFASQLDDVPPYKMGHRVFEADARRHRRGR